MRQETEHPESLTEQLIFGLVKWAWNWKFELSLVMAIWLTEAWAASLVGNDAGLILWLGM